MNNESYYLADLKKTATLFLQTNNVVELRVLNTKKGIVSGYYNDLEQLINDVIKVNGMGSGIYITMNPVNENLLARAFNKFTFYTKNTTKDNDIINLRHLLIDCDYERPAGISTTNEEHDLSLDKSRQIKDYLTSQGWPCPIVCDSGNGGHLLYSINLPNTTDNDLTHGLAGTCC